MRDCCSEILLQKKGPWTAEEDELLMNYINTHGEGLWKFLPHRTGLLRCGKSCRLRWMNYLRPNIRRGNITPGEDDIIIRMRMLLGNRWSLIAGRLPGRTDNEIKNYWNSHLSKRLKFRGIFPLGTPQLPFRHGKNDPDLNGPNEGDINNKNVVDADDAYDNEPKYKKYHDKKNVESIQRVKIFTPKPIRICTTSSISRVEVLAPKPIGFTGSAFSSNHFMTDMHTNNITSAIGNANNNSCIGRGENCKIIEEDHKFFDKEDVEEKNHCYEVCTDYLGIDDRCWPVPYQENSENLVTNEPRTLEMVYEEYLRLLESRLIWLILHIIRSL